MKIYNTIKRMVKDQRTVCKFGYIKELNIKLQLNDCCLKIIKLDNALKTGKTCEEIVVTPESYTNSFSNKFLDYRNNTKLQLEEIVNNILACDFESLQENGFEVEIRLERKGINTFSPFAEVKPLSKTPTKWTKLNIVKAILSGQIFKGVKVGHYTDDYVGDASCNFGKGVSLDLLELAQDLISSPDGWKFRTDKEENGIIEISADCYSFDYNKLFFDITCDSKEKAQEVVNNEEQERENKNNELKNECIKIEINSLDKDGIYQVEYLKMNDNTNELEKAITSVNYYGLVNAEYNEIWSKFWNTLKLEKLNIDNSDFFRIADLRDYDVETIKTDERYIVSKLDVYLSGKGLIEYSKDGYSCSKIIKANTKNLVSDMIKEQKGILFSMFPSDKELEIKNINMIERFKNELNRVKNNEPTPPEDKQQLPEEKINNKEKFNNVIQVDFTNGKAELKGQATRRQLYALHCLSKVNTTNLDISKQVASELIAKGKQGISISNDIKMLLEQNKVNVL